MANRGKELCDEVNTAIVRINEDGLSGREIAKTLKINESTVQKLLKRFRVVENTPRSGLHHKYTRRNDRQVLRIVKTNRRKTSTTIYVDSM